MVLTMLVPGFSVSYNPLVALVAIANVGDKVTFAAPDVPLNALVDVLISAFLGKTSLD